MATVTAALNAQAIGSGANAGNGLYAYKLTKQAASTVFHIEVTLTTGAGAAVESRAPVDVYFAASALSLTAANAKAQLQNAKCLRAFPSASPSTTRIYSTDVQSFVGDYLYIWADVPNLPVDGVLDIDVSELP